MLVVAGVEQSLHEIVGAAAADANNIWPLFALYDADDVGGFVLCVGLTIVREYGNINHTCDVDFET